MIYTYLAAMLLGKAVLYASVARQKPTWQQCLWGGVSATYTYIAIGSMSTLVKFCCRYTRRRFGHGLETAGNAHWASPRILAPRPNQLFHRGIEF